MHRLLLLLVLATSAFACIAPPAAEDVDASEAELGSRAVFERHRARGGMAAGWFDPSRGAVFSLDRQSTATWIERRWDGTEWTTTKEVVLPEHASPEHPFHGPTYPSAFDGTRLLLLATSGLWSWDGSALTKLVVPSLPPIFEPSMAFDSHRKRLVIFGKQIGERTFSTWEWDGTTLAKLESASSSIPTRSSRYMTYDAKRRRVVLLGGAGREGAEYSETWEWDGAAWTNQARTLPLPSCPFSSLAYDSRRKRTVLFGEGCDVREWNGAWSTVAMPSAWEGITNGLAAYDRPRKRMIVWSGSETISFGFTNEGNSAPTLAPVESREVVAGESAIVTLESTDADGTAPVFTVTPFPAGSRLDPNGVFVFRPGFDMLGPHVFTFAASDGTATTTQTATFTVVEPVFTPWFPRGAVRASGSITVTMWQDYAPAELKARPMKLTCTVEGDNPTALKVSCDGEGTFVVRDGPFGPWVPEPVAFEAMDRINGYGRFVAMDDIPNLSIMLHGKVVPGGLDFERLSVVIRHSPEHSTDLDHFESVSLPLTVQ